MRRAAAATHPPPRRRLPFSPSSSSPSSPSTTTSSSPGSPTAAALTIHNHTYLSLPDMITQDGQHEVRAVLNEAHYVLKAGKFPREIPPNMSS